MAERDYYQILRVARNASREEIRKSYRKLARIYHPDVKPGDKNAEEMFKEISLAYEVLGDADKRKLAPSGSQQGLMRTEPGRIPTDSGRQPAGLSFIPMTWTVCSPLTGLSICSVAGASRGKQRDVARTSRARWKLIFSTPCAAFRRP